MKNKSINLLVFIACSILFLFAYFVYMRDVPEQPDALQVTEPGDKVIEKEVIKQGGYGIVAGTLEPSLNVTKVNNRYELEFRIKNQTEEPQTLYFTSGQKFDFVIKQDEKLIYRYSRDMNFTMAIEEKTLKQGEEVFYREVLPPLSKGIYSISIWSSAKNQDIKAALEFKIDN